MEKHKDCFGKFNTKDCYCCLVAVECYDERNDQLMDRLARG